MELQPLTSFQLWSNNLAKSISVLMTKCYDIFLPPYFSPWVLFLKSTFHIALTCFLLLGNTRIFLTPAYKGVQIP